MGNEIWVGIEVCEKESMGVLYWSSKVAHLTTVRTSLWTSSRGGVVVRGLWNSRA